MRNALFLFVLVTGFSLFAAGQAEDMAVVVGARFSPSASSLSGTTTVNTAAGFEANLGVQIIGLPFASFQVETPILLVPNATIDSANAFASKSYSSIFITPGVRFKFKPTTKFNPWVAAGGGLVRFGPSPISVAGGTTSASGALKGTFDIGGGLDFKAPHVPFTWRVEAREYFSGSPNLNVANLSLHSNLFVGIGLVLRF
jgi:hypothetical protein